VGVVRIWSLKPELCTNPPYCDGFRGRGDESVILRFD